MLVIIVDYGMGNIASARRSFEEVGASVLVSDEPQALARASHVVVPGVGAFAEAIGRLTERGWPAALHEAALVNHVPLLGICLGMQLLADEGEEGETVAGLGLIPGRIIRLVPTSAEERIPHVGWNDVHVTQLSPIFNGIPDHSDFYFVHSYHFVARDRANILATTDYCGGVVAAVSRDAITGVQFHPEKSSLVGRRLLQNFLARRC